MDLGYSYLLFVPLLALRILKWLLDFWKICAFLVDTVGCCTDFITETVFYILTSSASSSEFKNEWSCSSASSVCPQFVGRIPFYWWCITLVTLDMGTNQFEVHTAPVFWLKVEAPFSWLLTPHPVPELRMHAANHIMRLPSSARKAP